AFLVRVREHVLVPIGAQDRGRRQEGGRAACVGAFPSGAHLRGAGLGRLALQRLPGEGPLHVAGHGAPVLGQRHTLQEALELSAQRRRRRQGGLPREGEGRALAPRVRAGRLPGQLCRGPRDRGVGGDPLDTPLPRVARRAYRRAGRGPGQQAPPARADPAGGRAGDLRRPELRGRRRTFLGQRPPGGRPRVGVPRPV
ncbi:MAG: 2-hydroxychromene-2-carboxylate isomerase family protein, partial [uncultured Rubrobacteraceae bacterium]